MAFLTPPQDFIALNLSEERTQIKKVPLRSLNKAESIALGFS